MHLSLLEPFADLSEGFRFYLKAILQCFQRFKNQLHSFFSFSSLFFPGCLSSIPHLSAKCSLKVFPSVVLCDPHDPLVYYEATEAERQSSSIPCSYMGKPRGRPPHPPSALKSSFPFLFSATGRKGSAGLVNTHGLCLAAHMKAITHDIERMLAS